MQIWFNKVKKNVELIPLMIEHYEAEYTEAKDEVRLISSGFIEKASAALPHMFEHRFAQLQDMEAVLEHLNIEYRRIRSDTFKRFFENQKAARALTAKECEKYVDGDAMVVAMAELINEVAFVRNLFLSILKGLDNKSYQLNNITRLRVAGLDDAKI